MSKRLPCQSCGDLRWPIKTGVPVAACHSCRRARVVERPTVERWTCARCNADCSRPPTRGQRPRYCETCQDRDWISRTRRFAIYERDEWTCWLCREAVDRTLIGTRSPWRPSLDHVTPRSKGGPDADENLALAHQWCNVVRGDGRVHTPEVFRVPA